MTRLIKPLRFFFRWVVPACFAVVLILKTLAAPGTAIIDPVLLPALDIAYKILLASMVGYFTNFLAIKMLFKPKNKTRHGFQGLVPGNQEQIAQSLGDAIAENFFNARDLIDYVKQNDLIATSVSGMKTYLEVNLENPENQRAITQWILNTFQSNSPRIYYLLQQLSEINLSYYLREKIDFEALMKELTKLIERNIADGTINLKTISRELTDFIHQHVPELSKSIYQQINRIIERQGTFKRKILKLATWTFDLDQQAIEEHLYDTVSSPDFRQKVYRNIEQGLQRLTAYLDSEAGTRRLNVYYRKLLIEAGDKIRDKGVPFLLMEIDRFLQKEASWRQIEAWLKKGLNFLEKTLEGVIVDERFDAWLTRSMPKILEKIKVASIVTDKVRAYDTDKLEAMVLDASGEHLTAIEVLGGILGGFAGIALFNPLLFLLILVPLATLGLIEYVWTVRYRRKRQKTDIADPSG